jgi:uncharacterized surface anchored protein
MGRSLLHEVDAPSDGRIGYLANPTDVPFEVSAYHDWDDPLVIVCKDAPAKGRIELYKDDALSGKPVAGATYKVVASADIYTLDGTLRATEGEVVATLVTDGDGYAITGELYLGSYYVQEAAAPDGYALSPERYAIDLSYQGQYATAYAERVEATDEPTTLELYKLDSQTGEPLAGVTFAVEDDKGNTVEIVSGDGGKCPYPYLPRGSYTVYEVATLPGYLLSDEAVEITVDTDGLIEGQHRFEFILTNDFTKVEISKTDIATGELVVGATLQIFPVDADGNITEEPLYEWVSTGEPCLIERFPQGNYILREISAPAGYVVAEDVSFTVADTGDIQRVEMADDFTRVEIVKVDAKTQKPLAGATLQVIDAEGNVIFEWVSTEEPFLIERIPQSDYTLHEVTAPAGYELAEDVSFTVGDSPELLTVTMADELTPEEPDEPLDKTGRDGSLPFAAVGILALLVLGGALFAVRHLRKRNGTDSGTDSTDVPDEGDRE